MKISTLAYIHDLLIDRKTENHAAYTHEKLADNPSQTAIEAAYTDYQAACAALVDFENMDWM